MACKTSHFKSQTDEGEAPAIEVPTVTSKAPASPKPKTEPIDAVIDTKSIETATTELQLNQSCDKPVQLLSMVQKFSFLGPKTTCSFGVAPNLERKNNFVQAREVFSRILKLPDNSEICSISLESPPDAKIRYDDFILFTIDDFVLFSSNKELVAKLNQVNAFYLWDFSKVVEMPIVDFKSPAYCVGAAERCKFPLTETDGPVTFKLNYAEIAGIAKAIQGKASVPFNLIATGDDNDVDCFYTDLDLSITLNYIKKPKP